MQPHNNTGAEKRFLFSLLLTFVILFAEVAGGLWTGSLALLSDAAHVFMDLFALGLSFIALRMSARPADDRHTYGYHRMEVLAALANGATLVIIAIGIGIEAYERWTNPQNIRGVEMLTIAVLGLLVNLVVARILGGHDHYEDEHGHEHNDLNTHSAFLHVLGDAISSIGVIIAALIIMFTNWRWVDPLVSLFIAIIILVGSYRVLRSSLHILVEGTPDGISLAKVSEVIRQDPAVVNVHDLHVWNICSDHITLSAHIVLEEEARSDSEYILEQVQGRLQHEFNIVHTTIQIDAEPCCEACNGETAV